MRESIGLCESPCPLNAFGRADTPPPADFNGYRAMTLLVAHTLNRTSNVCNLNRLRTEPGRSTAKLGRVMRLPGEIASRKRLSIHLSNRIQIQLASEAPS